MSVQLCLEPNCNRILGHSGPHNEFPQEMWSFLSRKDQNKIAKSGFATPRGGWKGAYQNHVSRSSKVIIPYERLDSVDLNSYEDGYSIRLFPEQAFAGAGILKEELTQPSSPAKIGENAFVLYRTHESIRRYPPLSDWQPRFLTRDGAAVSDRRGEVVDLGHYVCRISNHGQNEGQELGPPQGIFAPEYASETVNFQSKALLAWLIVHTMSSPYTAHQAAHLRAVLQKMEILNIDRLERTGVLRRSLTSCPLCLRHISYSQLHELISFEDEHGLLNAANQIEGSTRSTVVNLFHITPLVYTSLEHKPETIGWGHAICNTKLGQRHCYSLAELVSQDRKVAVLTETGFETFGWISKDWQMIRSSNGAVWIQIASNMTDEELQEGYVTEEEG